MEFDVIYAGTREELYKMATLKVAEGWNLEGDAGVARPKYESDDNPIFVYFYHVITKTGEVDFEANRERLLKMAEEWGIEPTPQDQDYYNYRTPLKYIYDIVESLAWKFPEKSNNFPLRKLREEQIEENERQNLLLRTF